MCADLMLPWSSEYQDYLHDESRATGRAESISFAAAEAEVVEVIGAVRARGGTLTTQGARTGITSGAVPDGGHILNLQRMKAIGPVKVGEDNTAAITVQPGALLQDVSALVASEGWFFPPDPTETSASIGGMVACNASGAMSHHYGPTRQWIRALRLVLSDGSMLSLRRGEQRANGRSFSLTTDSGRTISGRLPSYELPRVKSAAGYYVADDMDLLDLFIGMEGTLAIVTEAELTLIPSPPAVVGLTAFLPSDEAALQLVRALRGEGSETETTRAPVAMEFFDGDALALLRRMKAINPAFEAIPVIDPEFRAAVYAEFHADDEETAEEALLEALDPLLAAGGSDENTWAAMGARELKVAKEFRHAVPEAVNLLIAERKREVPDLTKLSTDMSVPDAQLEAAMAMYREGLAEAQLESVIFGHIADNHVHVNILPHSMEDYERGRELYHRWAERVVAWGGSVSAEHGIGKLKVGLLEMMYGERGIAEMRELRRLFDPEGVLNPGNLFAA